MQWKLFEDLAEAAGDRTVEVETDGDTVGDALDALIDAKPALSGRVLTDDGALQDHVNLLRNGEAVDTDATVEQGDELALFPPVSGG